MSKSATKGLGIPRFVCKTLGIVRFLFAGMFAFGAFVADLDTTDPAGPTPTNSPPWWPCSWAPTATTSPAPTSSSTAGDVASWYYGPLAPDRG